jgi:hypothetical protein
VEKSANAAITALKLPKGKTIDFHFQIEFEKYTERTEDLLQKLCKRWAEDNGLEKGSIEN